MHDPRIPVSLPETLRAYDTWAPAYDTFDNPLVAMTEHALDAAPLRLAGRHVVELGCGTGRNAARVLAAGAASYLGVDGSEGMLARARQGPAAADGRVRLLHADLGGPLPLAPGSAQAVLVTLVLEHVPHLLPLFAEVQRLLAPGGTCRFVEIHPSLVEGGVQAHFRHEGAEYRLASFPHRAEEYTAALLAAGLEPASLCEWFATGEAERRCAKLSRYRGRPVVLDVQAVRP